MAQPKVLNDQIDAFSEDATPSTGAFQLPVGTTAQRPSAPEAGMVRYNTSLGTTETFKALNWYETAHVLRATQSLNFGSLGSNGGEATLTITVTGADVSDYVFVTASGGPPAGVIFQAYVSALNTVSVRASNVTPGAIDPPAQDFLVLVFKA